MPFRPTVVLDLQGTQSPAHRGRGIGRYVAEHAAAMERVRPGYVDRFLLNANFAQPPEVDPLLTTGRVRFGSPALHQSMAYGPLIYHVMSPFEFDIPLDVLWPIEVRRPDVRLVVTLYDVIPHIYPEVYLADPAHSLRYHARLGLLRHADLILAISEATRNDAIERLQLDPGRVEVIGGGVNPMFRPSMQGAALSLEEAEAIVPGLRPGYVLLPGGADFRKNMERTVRAYARMRSSLRERHQLVIACRMSESFAAELRRIASEAGASADLLLTDYVADPTLLKLYQGARLTVFPSLYEGFGLPVAEAIACDVPVVVSNTSSLPELISVRGGSFDPHDEAEMTQVIEQGLTDEALRDAVRAEGRRRLPSLTWDRVAERSLARFDALSWPTGRRPPRREHLAVFSPYPPQFSGIASYTCGLLPRLSERCSVDVFVDGDPAEFDVIPDAPWRVLNAATFPTMRALVAYDHVLYCMGNSHLHGFIMSALRQVPGAVLLHDARLAGFYAWEGTTPDGFPAGVRVDAQYGDRVPGHLRVPETLLEPQVARDAGIWLLGEVLQLSKQVLVHSQYSKQVALLEGQMVGAMTPVRVVPFGFPTVEAPIVKDRLSTTIVSLGIVADVKRPVDIIEAMALVLREVPNVELVFAGLAQQPAERAAQAAAAALGITHAVRITGAIEADEYWAQLRTADVAIQLRAFSQGEASLTVAEAMSAGLPVVVSRLGWMGELPEAAVVGTSPQAPPSAIAEVLLRLLRDDAHRAAVSTSARSYAESQSFKHAADAILDALSSVPSSKAGVSP